MLSNVYILWTKIKIKKKCECKCLISRNIAISSDKIPALIDELEIIYETDEEKAIYVITNLHVLTFIKYMLNNK